MNDPLFPEQKEPAAIVKERKLLNRWSIFGLLVVSAAVVVLYVSNVVRVNTMMRDMQSHEKTRDSLVYSNQGLQSEIMRLQSAERITTIAKTKLGMIPNPQVPKKLP
ncbi:MAG: cell division protein FtsL [Bacteroidetes bacterium]|nr:cell division protein FtsL [Bacteroidota bacterium]